jgi:transcriptional regulator with XRE-family HTH domain
MPRREPAAERPQSVGVRLRELRERAGLSQRQMAVTAGVGDSLTSRIEHVSRYDPRLSTLKGFARALKVSIAALVRALDG